MKTPAGLELVSLLLKLRFRRKQVASKMGVPLANLSKRFTQADAYTLFALYTLPDSNIAAIAESLGLERSWVSRLIKSLVSKRLIIEKRSPVDPRNKQLALSASGRRAVDEIDTELAAITTELLAPLTQQEADDLRTLFRKLGDGFGIKPATPRPCHHLINPEFRRVTFGMGILGDNFMQSGQNVNKCQILDAVSAIDGGATVADAAAVLPVDASTVSRTVTALVKEGFLSRAQGIEDKREALLRLTTRGSSWIASYQTRANTIMLEACSSGGLSAGEIERFNTLLRRFVVTVQPRSRTRKVLLQDKVEMSLVRNSNERSEAAEFLLAHAPPNVPGTDLEDPTNCCYALHVNDNLEALCVISISRGTPRLDCLVTSSHTSGDSAIQTFLTGCLRDFFRTHRHPELAVQAAPGMGSALEGISARRKSSDLYMLDPRTIS